MIDSRACSNARSRVSATRLPVFLRKAMVIIERRSFDWKDWDKRLSAIPNAVVFQSAGWLQFLSEALNAEVITAVLRENNEDLGYFCGLKVKKLGMRVLGSPFRGWSTPYMGFAL